MNREQIVAIGFSLFMILKLVMGLAQIGQFVNFDKSKILGGNARIYPAFTMST